MKFTIEQANFATVLARSSGVVQKRNTIPILGYVLIKAAEGAVSTTGTDMDIEVTSHIEANVTNPGETCVSADVIESIVKKLPKGSLVMVEQSGNSLRIVAGRYDFTVNTLPAHDFPHIASSVYEAEFNAPQDDLKKLLASTDFAMSSDEMRPNLKGVYLHPVNGKARAVATDGHRLAQADSTIEANFNPVIVPAKTVSEIKKILDIGECAVSVSETKIRVDAGHTVIVSKVLDVTYPDYTRVIPVKNPNSATFDAEASNKAVSAVMSVNTSVHSKTKTVEIAIGADSVNFRARGLDVGNGEVDVEADVSGGEISIGINGNYLSDALERGSGEVTLEYNGSMDTLLMRYADNPDLISVLMPLRI